MSIKHLELFSGIGGFRKAFDLLSKDFCFQHQCIGFSEIDLNAIKTYQANFETANELAMGDIITYLQNNTPSNIDDFSFLTAGFPCQPFSMMGLQQGFNDVRGSLFFKIVEIIKTKKPQFILLENVRNITTHNNGKTLQTILQSLKDNGYCCYYDVFDTANFGLSQRRQRVFIFASSTEIGLNFKLTQQNVINNFNTLKTTSLLFQKNTLDVLEKNVDSKYYLSEKIKPTILSDGSRNFKSKSEINLLTARPLTATMAKMHRACQDNYFSDDFIDGTLSSCSRKVSKEELCKKRIRRITPKEALLLQGFHADFYENAKKAGVSDHQLYKQAGNAVSVNTVYAILHYILASAGII